MALINFYRGLREKYDVATHIDGIYFSTDTFEILVNGKSYGGSGVGLENVEFTDGKLIFTFADGTTKEAPIPMATSDSSGLMSAEDKKALDEILASLGGDLENLDFLKKSDAGVGVLANYAVAVETAGILPTDTINQAIGKLEKALNDLGGSGSGSIEEQITVAIDTLVGGASEGYRTLKELEDAVKSVDTKVTELEPRVKTNEDKLTVIQGDEATEGSINKALKDAKDYTDLKLTWTMLD